MKRSPSMLFAALLPLCAVGWAQSPEASATKPAIAKVSFDPKSDHVRAILRTAAIERSAESHPDRPGPDRSDDASMRIARTLALKFRGDRRVDHVECDALQCYAYTRAGEMLFTTPRDPRFGSLSEVPRADAALSCLDTNDLLSTFERIDLCRGIGVGVPLRWSNGGFDAPVTVRDGPR